jgi:hypothetical protein
MTQRRVVDQTGESVTKQSTGDVKLTMVDGDPSQLQRTELPIICGPEDLQTPPSRLMASTCAAAGVRSTES